MKKYLAYGIALIAGISLNLSFVPAISGVTNNTQVVQACSAKVDKVDAKEQMLLSGQNKGKYETDLTFFAKKSKHYDLVINYFDKDGKQVGQSKNPSYSENKGSKYTYNDKQVFTTYVASAKITFVRNSGHHNGEIKKSFNANFNSVKIPAPTFSGVNNINVPRALSLAFDPLKGVSASDILDGDLTNKISVSGQVKLEPGKKNVLVYSVTNSNGVTTTANRVVTVSSK